MSEYAEQDIEKLSSPPLVHDCTHPDAADDDDAEDTTGAVVAVVGTPIDGSIIGFRAADGFYRVAVTTADGDGNIVVDVDGNIVLGYP